MIGNDVQVAGEYLTSGEVVGIPTETVYGLAGNALNEAAIVKIFSVKNRPYFDPLIVHVASTQEIEKYCHPLPEQAYWLAHSFLPGPLTLLLPKKKLIPDLVTAGLPNVAIRVPAHPMLKVLLEELDFPLAAPSANPFGYISPTTAQHVEAQLGNKIPYILDGGPCAIGLESTIIGWEAEQPVVYRKGGLPVEKIEAVIGKVEVRQHSSSQPAAPGQLKSHYAPAAPLKLGNLQEMITCYKGKRIGLLSLCGVYPDIPQILQVKLSMTCDLNEAARNFFSAMRYLDGLDLEVILAEWMPEEGLGRAINDRLRRAAAL